MLNALGILRLNGWLGGGEEMWHQAAICFVLTAGAFAASTGIAQKAEYIPDDEMISEYFATRCLAIGRYVGIATLTLLAGAGTGIIPLKDSPSGGSLEFVVINTLIFVLIYVVAAVGRFPNWVAETWRLRSRRS